jgi:hypothetical protein
MAPLRRALGILLILLASFHRRAVALYGANSPVLHDLTDDNYKSKLKGLTILELYAPVRVRRETDDPSSAFRD